MSDIQTIKDQLSILEVIGERVKLTNAGAYYRGLCPFHHEKTPSFFVNDQLGFYKCYGCSEHGDIFDFVMKYDNLTFREALEMLAERAGVTLSQKTLDPQDQLRARVSELLTTALNYYEHNLLTDPDCQNFRTYLTARGITSATQNLFHLGAAKNEWEGLTNFLRARKFNAAEMTASGLIGANKTGRLFDRFRARLMFPLKNHRGQIVGFSGRLLVDDPNEGKYINTPETLVYHKGKMLYGLYELGQEIKKAGTLIVVEGEFDLLSSVQAKVNNVAAIKGSAFTPDQATLVSRFAKKVVLALDSDQAGVTATKKAIEVLRPVGVEVEVILLDKGQDPDDLARTDPKKWREKTSATTSVYDFFLQVTLAGYNLQKISDQKKILQQLAGIFDLIDNRLEYEYYLNKLAQALGQDKEIIRVDLKNWRQMGELAKKARTLPTPNVAVTPARAKHRLSKLERLEAYIWFLLLQCLAGETNIAAASRYIQVATWQNPYLQNLADRYRQYYAHQPQPTLKGWYQSLPDDLAAKIATLSLNQNFSQILAKTKLEDEWVRQTTWHQQQTRKLQITALSAQLKELETSAQLTAAQEKKKQKILAQIMALKS
jgi:DNA primase